MKDIKMQAWTDEGMIQIQRLTMLGDDIFYAVATADKFDGHEFQLESENIRRSTGAKDKNGVDIYEGDIVKAWSGDFWMRKNKTDTTSDEYETFYVKWDNTELRWRCEDDSKGAGWYPSIENNPGRLLYEVIGNVYENPELLNEKA